MIKKIIQQIKSNKSFLVTTHINLEGDAIGSLLAMRDILLYLKKKVELVVLDKIPEEYRFLPDINYINNIKKIRFSDYDVLVVLDVSDRMRCPKIFDLFPKNRTVINIDHHISNTKFGSINWIDSGASSTAEMLYRLYRRLNIPLNKKRAIWLYTGLLTDTGSFRYPNTRSYSLRLAAKLISYGLDVNRIYQAIYYNLNLEDIEFFHRIISTIKTDKTKRIIWFKIKRDFFRKYRPKRDLTDQILDLGRMVRTAEVVALFKENSFQRDKIHVNLRSKNKIDVDRIARFFGGGGHRTASGCSLKTSLNKAEKIVINKIKEYIR